MVIEELTKRRNEIASQIRELKGSLTHLDATINLFQADYKIPKAQRGDVTRILLDTLRTASQPMTTREIAEAIGSTVKRTGLALNHQRRKGVINSIRDGQAMRWEIAR